MNLPTHMSGQFSGQVPNQSGTSLSAVPHQKNIMQTAGGQRNTLNGDPGFGTVRRHIQERIYEFLMRRPHTRELDQKKVIDIVRRLEESLFKTATTKEEYMNSETLENRLHVLIKRLPYSNHNQQYQQQGNTSVPMGTMIPNPGMPQSGNLSIMDAMVPPAVNTGNFLPNNTGNFLPNNTRIPSGMHNGSLSSSDAQKFESLIAPEEDSEREIQELLEIDEENRRFGCVPVIASESHSAGHSHTDMSTENLFDLEDLSSLMSVKKEKVSPLAPKSRPVTRAAKSKKRKPSEMIDLESNGDSIAKVQEGIQMWIEERKVMHDEPVEVKATQKTAYDRCAVLEKEILLLKKQIKDLSASSTRKIQETIEGAKRSAVTAILQSKIQMATEAGDKGLELWKENLDSWTAILEKMKKEKPATSVNIEAPVQEEGETGTSKDAGGDRGEEVVEARFAGDDGCHA